MEWGRGRGKWEMGSGRLRLRHLLSMTDSSFGNEEIKVYVSAVKVDRFLYVRMHVLMDRWNNMHSTKPFIVSKAKPMF